MTDIVEMTDLEIAAVAGGQTWWEWFIGVNEPGEREPTGPKG